MQLFALDNSSPISARRAQKGKNYLCPECNSLLRVRGGLNRQIHFYHVARQLSCRQHQKSLEHLQLQLKVLDLIGGEQEGQVECPFPDIGRIADVAWHSRKIVFEIQCSPISLQEAKERNGNYSSIGYEVVWILHEKRFNKRVLSAAELFLRTTPCYFTDIDRQGNGKVYDQFEVLKGSYRCFKGPQLSVCIEQLSIIPANVTASFDLPQSIKWRLSNWKFFAKGDLMHRLIREGTLEIAVKRLLWIETSLNKEKKAAERLSLLSLIVISYGQILRYFLKKACK